MSDATAALILAIACIAVAIGITAWLIRRRSYQIKSIHFQRALWQAMKRQHERERQQRAARAGGSNGAA